MTNHKILKKLRKEIRKDMPKWFREMCRNMTFGERWKMAWAVLKGEM